MNDLIKSSRIASFKLESEAPSSKGRATALIKFTGGHNYRGEVLGNKPHGQGRFSLNDGSFYEGTF